MVKFAVLLEPFLIDLSSRATRLKNEELDVLVKLDKFGSEWGSTRTANFTKVAKITRIAKPVKIPNFVKFVAK